MDMPLVKRKLPSLNGLRAFESAARHLSFTRAAEELSVTQAAVSHQIRALEDRLGLKLFVRRNRGLYLTEAGQAYLPAVRAAFDQLDRATRDLTRQDEAGVLTVSTIASFAVKWLVPRLAGFQAACPEIEVRITTRPGLVDFARDDVDMAIRYGHGVWDGLRADRLLGEDMFPVCSPALIDGDPPLRAPADLARHRLLHASMLRDDWRVWLTAAGVTGVDPTEGLVLDLQIAAVQAAVDGLGVALGHAPLVEADIAAGRLVAPFDIALPVEAAYYVVAPESHADRPKIKAFRDWLLQTAAEDRTEAR